jgi:protein TonB
LIINYFDPFGYNYRRKLAGKPDPASYEMWKDRLKGIVRIKKDKANLQKYYIRYVESGAIATLLILILAFQAAKSLSFENRKVAQEEVHIEVEDIPVTQQINRPPPPQRPALPVPTESEEIPDDLTIDATDLDFSDIPAPPPPPELDEEQIFVAYDEAPEIIGGMAALLNHLKFPTIARKSGVECTVIAKVLVSKEGVSRDVEILKLTQPEMGFEEEAISAIKKVKWKPARQRDRAISTWVSIPVHFRLTN